MNVKDKVLEGVETFHSQASKITQGLPEQATNTASVDCRLTCT